ncbi:aphrodisiN [Caudoviricetes sp.]|nr:aphrodisiN [Caudoviricetes sp.]
METLAHVDERWLLERRPHASEEEVEIFIEQCGKIFEIYDNDSQLHEEALKRTLSILKAMGYQ